MSRPGLFVVPGFDEGDSGALIRSGSFHNADDTENLLVSLDSGDTFPIVVRPGTHWPLPASDVPYKLGGDTDKGVRWKASANTISVAAFLYVAFVEAEAAA